VSSVSPSEQPKPDESSSPTPVAPPGYPMYPQVGYGGIPMTNAYPSYPNYVPFYQNYGPYYYPNRYPPSVRRDTYRLVVGIICTILLSLVLIFGLLGGLITWLVGALAKLEISGLLVIWPSVLLSIGMSLIGGGIGLYFTIWALIGRPSSIMRLPSFILPLSLAGATFATIIILYDLHLPQGTAFLQTPILMLSGILPALTIFTLTSQRLDNPSTWRRVWLAFLSGMFLAAGLAIILNEIAAIIIAVNIDVLSTSTGDVFATLLLISIVAPLVEESCKVIGPIVIIGRIRTLPEAFLLGMASGIGFGIIETIMYISIGQRDWPIIAIMRIGSCLLHGLGAGMATTGWYILFRGKGIQNRFWKGMGFILYAVLQHAIFNGSTLLTLLPGPFGDMLRSPAWLFGLPITGSEYMTLGLYGVILIVLIRATRWLRQSSSGSSGSSGSLPSTAPGSISVPSSSSAIS
jgi:RsiW-degrading membrane proteinase PrsW (M82 family)